MSNTPFPAQATGVGSLFAIHLTGKAPIQDAKSFANSDHELSRKLFSHLLDNEILMVIPEMLHGAISHAHSDTNIRDLATTVEKFVKGNKRKRSRTRRSSALQTYPDQADSDRVELEVSQALSSTLVAG